MDTLIFLNYNFGIKHNVPMLQILSTASDCDYFLAVEVIIIIACYYHFPFFKILNEKHKMKNE